VVCRLATEPAEVEGSAPQIVIMGVPDSEYPAPIQHAQVPVLLVQML